jgi:phosphopantothenoylcysteine decarboxylase/phosphopantothenate--cysteine ligase
MGYAIAEELARQGAKVLLVSGPVSISAREKGIRIIRTESAEEMYQACMAHFPECDGAVMTAAVADFTPSNPATQKTKRKGENLIIELKPTKDIAGALGEIKRENQVLAGFALETQDEISNAQKKLEKKNLDFIVLNSLNDPGAGFGTDTNKITIIGKNNKINPFELKSKTEVAADIVEMIISILPE